MYYKNQGHISVIRIWGKPEISDPHTSSQNILNLICEPYDFACWSPPFRIFQLLGKFLVWIAPLKLGCQKIFLRGFLFSNNVKYHRDVIVSQRRDTLKIHGEKTFLGVETAFFLLEQVQKWNISSENTWKFQILKRASLPDILFCVKNMPKTKYHADVILSITQTW